MRKRANSILRSPFIERGKKNLSSFVLPAKSSSNLVSRLPFVYRSAPCVYAVAVLCQKIINVRVSVKGGARLRNVFVCATCPLRNRIGICIMPPVCHPCTPLFSRNGGGGGRGASLAETARHRVCHRLSIYLRSFRSPVRSIHGGRAVATYMLTTKGN